MMNYTKKSRLREIVHHINKEGLNYTDIELEFGDMLDRLYDESFEGKIKIIVEYDDEN
jgi:hypothetical protein